MQLNRCTQAGIELETSSLRSSFQRARGVVQAAEGEKAARVFHSSELYGLQLQPARKQWHGFIG